MPSVPYGATYLDVGEEHRAEAVLCEPYLRAFFPDGLPPSAVTPVQRRLAAAVAHHGPAWERDLRALPPRARCLASRDARAWAGTFSRLRLPGDQPSRRALAGLA